MSFFAKYCLSWLVSLYLRLHLNLWLRLYRSEVGAVCTGAAACAEKLLLENTLFLASAGSLRDTLALFRRCIVEYLLR